MVFARGEKGEFVLFPGYVTSFRMDEHNLHLLMTAAIVWTIYEAKPIEQKWHLRKNFMGTSHEQCVASCAAERTMRAFKAGSRRQ